MNPSFLIAIIIHEIHTIVESYLHLRKAETMTRFFLTLEHIVTRGFSNDRYLQSFEKPLVFELANIE